jgi:hypothetical protein
MVANERRATNDLKEYFMVVFVGYKENNHEEQKGMGRIVE